MTLPFKVGDQVLCLELTGSAYTLAGVIVEPSDDLDVWKPLYHVRINDHFFIYRYAHEMRFLNGLTLLQRLLRDRHGD